MAPLFGVPFLACICCLAVSDTCLTCKQVGRTRCPKLLVLPLDAELRTNVALLVGHGLAGADLGRVIKLAPTVLSLSPKEITERLNAVRFLLGASIQARL